MSFFNELKRRNVFRVGVAYVVVGWVLAQVAEYSTDTFGAPDWVLQMFTVFLLLGFPVALIFAWAFEMTPEGLKREKDVDRSQSITSQTGRKLDFIIIGILAVAVVFLAYERFVAKPSDTSPETVEVDNTIQPISLAVLAFDNMSNDAENEYFADGISEEILNLVASVRALEVASRTSAFSYKGTDKPVPEIARELKVRYVLEGSVRKSGERVRITAQLIDADNDRHLWSDTYDRTLDDIFAIQDEIAAAIGEQLQIQLLGKGGNTVTAETLDPAVYEQFLEARYRLRRRNRADIDRAVTMLEKVTAAEPNFARGLVTYAEALLLQRSAFSQEENAARFERAADLARRARALDPNLSGIYMVLGQVDANLNRDQLGYLEQLTRAIELEPNEPRPYHWRSILYVSLGYLDLAMNDAERVLELEPYNANVQGLNGFLLLIRGEPDRARDHIQPIIELGNPYGGYIVLWGIEFLAGNQQGVRSAIEQMNQLRPDLATFHQGLSRLADNPDDRALFEQLLAEVMESNDTFRATQFTLLLSSLGLGRYYLEAEKTLFEHTSESFLAFIIWQDINRSARQDPLFIESAVRNGFIPVWDKLGPPPDCRKEGNTYTCGHGYAR